MAASSAPATADSSNLLSMKCVPCARDGGEAQLLDPEAIYARREQICKSWSLVADGTKLERQFIAKNFRCAMACLQAYGEAADALGHHPDLHITSYRTVTVELTTHARGGITINDFIVAAKLDAIPVTYSPKWLRENPDTTAGVAPTPDKET